jgi:tRNA-dihydrouridine synthase C
VVVDPGLALGVVAATRAPAVSSTTDEVTWTNLLPLIAEFWQIVCTNLEPRQRAGRLKQWLNFMRRRFPEAEVAYQQLRTATDNDVRVWLAAELWRYDLG